MLDLQVHDATELAFVLAKTDAGGSVTYLREDRQTWTPLIAAATKLRGDEVFGPKSVMMPWTSSDGAAGMVGLRLVPARHLHLLRFAEIGRQALFAVAEHSGRGLSWMASVEPQQVLPALRQQLAPAVVAELTREAESWRGLSRLGRAYAAELYGAMRRAGLPVPSEHQSESQDAGSQTPHRRPPCASEPQGGPAGAKAGSPAVRGSRRAYLFAYLTKGGVRRVGYTSEAHPSVYAEELPLLLLESAPCSDFEAALLDLQAKLAKNSLLHIWLRSVRSGEVQMDSEIRRWVSLSSERA